MELWAAIDLLGGAAVTLVQGRADEKTVWNASPLEFAGRWQDAGADGLHVIDLDAAFGSGSNREVVARIVRESSVPVQVGGGIRSAEAARQWLEAGASRVVLGTLVFGEPNAAKELIEAHGAERLVAAADYRDGEIVTRGWKESQGIGVLQAVMSLEAQGFRNLLATSVGRDGTESGPDIATVEQLSSVTKMKVMASGGIRDVEDLARLEGAGAWATVIGRALYEGRVELAEARRRVR